MGSWKLEVFRMSLYVLFPVAMFHIFNNPEYFEESVIKTKRELCPAEDLKQIKALEDMKVHYRRQREAQIEQEFLKLK